MESDSKEKKPKEKRYPVVNFETKDDPKVENPLIKVREVEDYSLSNITLEEKKKYEYLGRLDRGEKKDEKYTRSQEYISYLKEKNKKEKEEISKRIFHS